MFATLEEWIAGEASPFAQDRVRLAANVLAWEQSGLLIRLEGTFSRDQALQIAASVH
jgi:hypothetical protein